MNKFNTTKENVEILVGKGFDQAEIAKIANLDPSAISRVINHGRDVLYDAGKRLELAAKRKKKK